MEVRHIIFALLHVIFYTFVVSLTFYAVVFTVYLSITLIVCYFKGGNKHVQSIQKEKDLS
jgi:hypothetical protein